MSLEPYRDHHPVVHPTAFVHPHAVVIGDVEIGPRASIWPGCVLRGDQGSIRIGAETSIQDGTVIHATRGLSVTSVGDRVTVGHKVILHGCTIEDDVLVGMGAIVMDNALVRRESVVGAAALVLAGRQYEARSMIVGSPAKRRRAVSHEELREIIHHGTEEYVRLAAEYLAGFGG